jgi:ATP-dependent DNA ligase
MREFRKLTGRNKKPQVWYINVSSNDVSSYIVKWGVLGGALQSALNTPGSCGVKGHSDYQTPEEYVMFCIEREIRKKQEEGYVEYVNGEPTNEVATSIDFNKPLPKNFCFYKPKKEVSDKKLADLLKCGRAVWTVKRDGMMHIAVKTKGIWEIYTRRMDLVTEKFPHIVQALEKLDVGNNTILLGEMVFLKEDRRDDFVNTSRICRSNTDLALAYQGLGEFPKDNKEKEVIGKIRYYVFDIAYHNGKDVISTTKTGDRLSLLSSCFSKINKLSITTGIGVSKDVMDKERAVRSDMLWEEYTAPLQIVHTNPTEDLEVAKAAGIEGFVVIDIDMLYGDRAYSFDGKPQRPEGIWKRKPKFDEEFIISDTYEGSGKNMNKLGGFFIQQIHPDTNELIDCGKCGGGFSDEQRQEFWQDRGELIGKVIKVEFDSRQPPKDGAFALRFPVFISFADKTPEECVAQFLGMKEE